LVLIGCANVATLLLSRMTARNREMTVRMALGASHGRIVRQMLTESLLLAGVGGAFGVGLSLACLPVLVHLIPHEWLTVDADLIRVNGLSLAVAVGLAVLMGIFFGLGPAWQISHRDFASAIKESAAKVRGDRHGHAARNFLAAAEIALSVVVLTSAALVVQSYRKLQTLDLGFRPEHLLSFEVEVPQSKYPNDLQVKQFYERVLESLRRVPSVQNVAAVSGRPMVDRTVDLTTHDLEIEGRPAEDARATPNANFRVISPDYFRAMGITVLSGRAFTERDGLNSQCVAVVNQTMAQMFWPGADAVGQRIRLGRRFGRRQSSETETAGAELTIVGVVADAKQIRVIDAPVRQEFYVPLAQRQGLPRGLTIEARTSVPPGTLTTALRESIHQVDPEQPMFDVLTMDEIVADSFGPKRLTLWLLTFFASVALILCAIGLYGIVAYSVSQRTQEIGVRVAIGAQPADLARMVLRQGVRLAATGLLPGLIIALAVTRLLGGLLYGVSASDPGTFVGVALLLFSAALAASYVPARRAMRVDPIVALRYE
jgi:putative ABC transport system permease protein